MNHTLAIQKKEKKIDDNSIENATAECLCHMNEYPPRVNTV